jgi:hypothetical protein
MQNIMQSIMQNIIIKYKIELLLLFHSQARVRT